MAKAKNPLHDEVALGLKPPTPTPGPGMTVREALRAHFPDEQFEDESVTAFEAPLERLRQSLRDRGINPPDRLELRGI